MRNFTDQEIIDRVASLESFQGWVKGIYSIWVRSKADRYDLFDDKGFIYEVEADNQTPKFIMSRVGTTNAGSYGLKHFDEYNHLGCAVACADVITYDSHVFGYHHHIINTEHEAYVQLAGKTNPMPYTRDGNRNEKAENFGEVYRDLIGMNDHHAGLYSTVIKNWSTACMVTAARAIYDKFMAFMKSKGKPPLNTVVLLEW